MHVRKLLFLFLIAAAALTAQKKKLTVEEIQTNPVFRDKLLSGIQWIEGGKAFTYLKMNPDSKSLSIFRQSVDSAGEYVFIDGSGLIPPGEEKPLTISNYKWSPDGKSIMFTGVLPARTLKTGGAFYVYDTETRKIIREVKSGEEQENIEWSPDSRKIAFVRGNNLYTFDVAAGTTTQLTFDGSETVLNGKFDWVYEEEFSIIRGYEWAPDGKSIAFWRLDQSPVPQLQIAKWDSLYFNFLTMRYPKAGAPNSLVSIHVVPAGGGKPTVMDIGAEADQYIPRIKYGADAGSLYIQRLNRLQNKLELLRANTATGVSKVVLTETSTTGWIEVAEQWSFLPDRQRFIIESERDGYKHFYLFTTEGKLLQQLTAGAYEAGEIVGVDAARNIFYYTANERGTIYKDLYAVSLDGSGKQRLTGEAGTYSINMSPACNYYTERYNNANTMSTTLLRSTDGTVVRELAKKDMAPVLDYNFSKQEFFTFTTSDGAVLAAAMIKPVDFDPGKKYPVLVYNYSGPGSQVVTDAWGGGNYLWHQVLANNGYIVFMLDNRGTGGRGVKFREAGYKNLGYWEVHDQIEGARYLASLEYVDASRIGIWGWSYGGYTAALTIMKAADYFKAAIAVAPVTDWKYYDNIYTERYMSLPALNIAGYDSSSVLAQTGKLKGKFLLVHGTGDDNVHFQNSVALAARLIAENKPFETMFYPEKDHGIYGGKTRLHLFTMLTKFIFENL